MPLETLLNYSFGIIHFIAFFWVMIVLRNDQFSEKEKFKRSIIPGCLMILTFVGIVRSWQLVRLFSDW